ncbi:MAG TPA: hypothetical protein VF476_05255 [Chitinophagaceae bacterium]
MIKAFSILFCLILFHNGGYAQVHRARYECLLGGQINIPDSTGSSNAGNTRFPLITRISYDLQADENYLYISSKIISSLAIPAADVENKASYSRVIIDLKKEIAYFPEEKEYKRVKKYQVIGTCVTDSIGNKLNGIDSLTLVQFSSKMPWFVSPGVILHNRDCGGITHIKTSDYTIKLISYDTAGTGGLNYSDLFKKIDINLIKKYYEFF